MNIRKSSTTRPIATTSCTAWPCWGPPTAGGPTWRGLCCCWGWGSSAAPFTSTASPGTPNSTGRRRWGGPCSSWAGRPWRSRDPKNHPGTPKISQETQKSNGNGQKWQRNKKK